MAFRPAKLLLWTLLVLLVIMLGINLNVLKPWGIFGRRSIFSEDEMVSSFNLCAGSSYIQLNSRAEMSNYSSLFGQSDSKEFRIRTELIELTAGHRREKSVYLTVGIPSIKRINEAEYLMRTLSSLDEQTSAAEKEMVVVVVFLADNDQTFTKTVSQQIQTNFPKLVDSGFIQVITVPPNIYPPLKNLKRNFNDPPNRVTWRSKQVVDFAIMFTYAHTHSLSDFYVQIEDDVICAPNYVPAIKDYVGKFSKTGTMLVNGKLTAVPHWVMLEFSELGFIGKLFRGSELQRLARFLLMFYDEQPVDWLMTAFRLSAGQRNVLLRKPTLFQHIGKKSSFDTSKDNPLKDKYFSGGGKPISGAQNPPAVVVSSMPPHQEYLADLAYSSGSGFFWTAKATAGDHVTVVLEEPAKVSRIAVVTGNEQSSQDLLLDGSLLISGKLQTLDEKNRQAVCEEPVEVGRFDKEGKVDVKGVSEKWAGELVKCIIIKVNKDQSTWVIFNQIAVFI